MLVTAKYPMTGDVDFEVELNEETLSYRELGTRRWARVPWNVAFAMLDAGIETDAKFAALRAPQPRKKKR